MPLLSEFVFRLGFGLALAMSVTPHARVTSGYFRNHLYVLFGLNVLATLASLADRERSFLWPAVIAAIMSYVGAVAWLYERPGIGIAALLAVAGLDLAGAWLIRSPHGAVPPVGAMLHLLDAVSGGLVVGSTIAAMFLGHWFLNSPTMELAPLQRLLKLMAAALVLRVTAAAGGLIAMASYGELLVLSTPEVALLTLRWLAGLFGMAGVIWMVWQTLKIPNTQSATGILYVGVILSFLGELVALLLSQSSRFPV